LCKGIILLIQSPPDPGIGLLQIKQHFFFLFSFLYFIPFFNNFLSYKVFFFWWIHLTIGLLVNCPFSIHEWILVLSSLNIKKMYLNFLRTSFHLSFFLHQKSLSRFFFFFFSLRQPDDYFFYIVLVLTLASTYSSLNVQNSFFFMHPPVFLQRPLLYKYLILNVSYFSWLVLQI